MKAKALICNNSEEINTARTLGLKEIPKAIMEPVPFVFHIHNVTFAYVHPNGNIQIFLNGIEISLEYEEELWKKLEGFIGG